MLASDLPNPDDALWVRFFLKPVQNNFRSEKEGHPCFDDVLFISIIAPADPNSKIERKANNDDKERFHKAWANFQNGNAEKVEGLPIEEWPQVTRSVSEELKYLGVRSVEQLAAASDAQVQKLMGGVSLREKAKAYLVAAKDAAAAQKFAAENKILRDEIEAMKAQIAALGSKPETQQNEGATAIPKRKAGRPKRVPAETTTAQETAA